MVSSQRTRPPVVVVTGPTGAGKTPIALALAERFAAEIVNADSMQVYRHLDVGTAKPSLEQRARVPHHLFDVVTPDVPYSAGRYAREAREAAVRIHARGAAVLLVGGTGLYIRAFLHGLVDVGGADDELRRALEKEHEAAVAQGDPARLHLRLAALDPAGARRIHPHDVRRIVRALEMAERTGVRPSTLQGAHAFRACPYRVLHLALDPGRERLDARIDQRCRQMLEMGLLREVRAILERGYGAELRPLQAIGYRHMIPVAQGQETLTNALESMQRDTRRFARRQRTWLRGVPQVTWVDPDDVEGIAKKVDAFLAPGAPGLRASVA
jgi:tRNA dimethylallyltransferase